MFDEDNDKANDSGTKGSEERRNRRNRRNGREKGRTYSVAYFILPIAYSMCILPINGGIGGDREGRIDAE